MLATAAAIFSALLFVTGIAKVARPGDVQRALVTLGLPRVLGIGRLLGLAEIAVGAGALMLPELLWLQTGMYAMFGVWVAAALRTNTPMASCGCLGRPDTPPTAFHLVLNLVAVVVSVGAALGIPLQIGSGFTAVAQVTVIGSGVFLSYVILNDLSRVAGVRSR